MDLLKPEFLTQHSHILMNTYTLTSTHTLSHTYEYIYTLMNTHTHTHTFIRQFKSTIYTGEMAKRLRALSAHTTNKQTNQDLGPSTHVAVYSNM